MKILKWIMYIILFIINLFSIFILTIKPVPLFWLGLFTCAFIALWIQTIMAFKE